METEKGSDPAADVQKALDELVQSPETPSLEISDDVQVGLLYQQYAALAQKYWALRTQGEICTIVGDKDEAKGAFKQAQKIVERITALGTVAAQRGVLSRYSDMVQEYLDKIREQRATERQKAVTHAAKTGQA